MSNICPVCFYPNLYEPAYHPIGKGGSDEICPCCGFQFGVTDDDRHISHKDWRDQWIAGGMKWRSQAGRLPPKDWDPRAQLSLGGIQEE